MPPWSAIASYYYEDGDTVSLMKLLNRMASSPHEDTRREVLNVLWQLTESKDYRQDPSHLTAVREISRQVLATFDLPETTQQTINEVIVEHIDRVESEYESRILELKSRGEYRPPSGRG
ncbi:MAG: hypothetical protein AMXMBFR33_27270 [Candidatus Xenobia bacterium]